LDSKTGRWLSGDPALGEYVPSAPVSEEARKRNGSLPGMGGVFNYVNLHVYHYAGNNPVKYTDPDGEITWEQHINRNRHQNGYAPSTRERMGRLVDIGLFTREGNTGTHNLTKEQNTLEGRRAVGIKKFGTNIDYRGARGTIFKGMQFIYNEGGEIVLDSINKGTFDYMSPLENIFLHDSFDIKPWIEWGNGPFDDKKEDVIMSEETWSKIEGILNEYDTKKITRRQAKEMIQGLFPPPPSVPEGLTGGPEY
jgi:hypothetical protein